MLTGAILGAVIMLLAFYSAWLAGKHKAFIGQINTLHEELSAYKISLGRYALLEQERLKLRELINIQFTDEQVTTLANAVTLRIRTLLASENAAALNKLD